MHPYGDRRDGSKSSGIETQEVSAKWQYNVVRVLILSDDLRDLDVPRLRCTPAQQVGQRMTARERTRDVSKNRIIDHLCGTHWDRHHGDPYGSAHSEVSAPTNGRAYASITQSPTMGRRQDNASDDRFECANVYRDTHLR